MSFRLILIVVGLAAMAAACGDNDITAPETSGQSAETPPATWDLVTLGDSTPTGALLDLGESAYPYVFAELIEQDLGVDVIVHNHATNRTLTVAQWVEIVQTDETLRANLADAEIVTIWLGWHNTINGAMGFRGDWSDDHREAFAEMTATTPDDFDALLAGIAEIGPDARIVIADGGIPPVLRDRWADEPYWPEMKRAIYLDWRDALVAAAEAHGATLVTVDDVSDPSLFHADGLHFSGEGHRFLAEVHHTQAALTVE